MTPTPLTKGMDETASDVQSTATFYLSDESVADTLKNCKIGEPEELVITFVPTAITKDSISGQIDEVDYQNPDEQTEEDTTETDTTGQGGYGKKMPRALKIT